MKREDGVLDTVLKDGTEIRFHFFDRNGVVRRVPWHHGFAGENWYSGIEGPEIQLSTLVKLVEELPWAS